MRGGEEPAGGNAEAGEMGEGTGRQVVDPGIRNASTEKLSLASQGPQAGGLEYPHTPHPAPLFLCKDTDGLTQMLL